MADKRDIIVVGGGIIGASIAWHLVAAGARVRLIAGKTGGVATPTSFAWINASWGNPEPYFRLRTRSMAEWRRLAESVPGLAPDWSGGLCWDLPEAELLAYAAEHGGWGYDIKQVTGDQAAAIEPALATPPDRALHVPAEGAIEPVAATLALIADARRRGLEVIEGVHVTALRETSGRIASVVTDRGEFAADSVVLAAGAGVAGLAATLGVTVPVEAPPGLLVHTRPVARLLNGLVIAPELHVRQTAEGRLVAGSDFVGTDPGNDPLGAARALFARLQAFLKQGDRLELDFHTVGYRPTPVDGFPIVGDCGIDGLYLAVSHSGVTLAPALGRVAAEEILEGRSEPLLAPYRLARFAAS